MARTLATRSAVALATLLAFGLPGARAQFSINQDTVITLDVSGTIREYTVAGEATGETLTVTGFGDLTGMTVLGSRMFVSNSTGNIGEVNLTTGGQPSLLFNAGTGIEGLGDNGVNLLTYNYSSGEVRQYTAAGSLVQTITVANQGGGVDGAGSRIFVSDLDAGSAIREYDSTGALVNTVSTGLQTGTMTGLGYDPINDTFWVATGFGDDRIREFNPSGSVLTDFALTDAQVVGVEFVPVPEPGACLAAAAGVLGLGALARRLRRAGA